MLTNLTVALAVAAVAVMVEVVALLSSLTLFVPFFELDDLQLGSRSALSGPWTSL